MWPWEEMSAPARKQPSSMETSSSSVTCGRGGTTCCTHTHSAVGYRQLLPSRVRTHRHPVRSSRAIATTQWKPDLTARPCRPWRGLGGHGRRDNVWKLRSRELTTQGEIFGTKLHADCYKILEWEFSKFYFKYLWYVFFILKQWTAWLWLKKYTV